MRFFPLLLFLISCLTGCQKEIDIPFGEPSKKLVLYPVLTSNKEIVVRMSAPTGILSESFPVLTNGMVIIAQDDVNVDTILINQRGIGVSRIVPAHGHKYAFTASASGYSKAYCEAYLPDPIESIDIDTTYNITFQFNKNITFHLAIRDDPGIKNFYRLTINLKQHLTKKVTVYNGSGYVAYDSGYVNLVKPQLYSNIPNHGFFSIWNGNFLLSEEVIDIAEGSSYKYNLGSDVYFYGREFYFSDELHNGKEILLNIIVGGPVFSVNPENYIIEISSISEDYYKGLKSYARYGVRENSDLPFSEEVTIYTSVENGYGFPLSFVSTVDSSYWMPRFK